MSQSLLVLASGSPRRRELIATLGIPFRIQVPDVDEAVLPSEHPQTMVERLALDKAAAATKAFQSLHPKERFVTLAADTTVYLPAIKKILGKPSSQAEAEQMVAELSGKFHEVYTGFAWMSSWTHEEPKVRTVRTQVWIRALSPEEIQSYVRTGEPMDKAGAYAAQGLGMGLVEKIEGSYTNVVGLPLAEVSEVLRDEFGYRITFSEN